MKGFDNGQKTKKVQFRVQGQGSLGRFEERRDHRRAGAAFRVHPTMISVWKRSLLESAADIFDKTHSFRKLTEEKIDELHRQIGKLKVENDFLSRKLDF
jgi:transposase